MKEFKTNALNIIEQNKQFFKLLPYNRDLMWHENKGALDKNQENFINFFAYEGLKEYEAMTSFSDKLATLLLKDIIIDEVETSLNSLWNDGEFDLAVEDDELSLFITNNKDNLALNAWIENWPKFSKEKNIKIFNPSTESYAEELTLGETILVKSNPNTFFKNSYLDENSKNLNNINDLTKKTIVKNFYQDEYSKNPNRDYHGYKKKDLMEKTTTLMDMFGLK